MSLQEVRDLVIIIAGAIAILLLFAGLVLTVVIGVATRALIGAAQHLINEQVAPVVESARGTVETVKGTSSFITEIVVSPIIRLYGFIMRVRRILAVLTGFVRRERGEQETEQAE
jgi:hypothetical protein